MISIIYRYMNISSKINSERVTVLIKSWSLWLLFLFNYWLSFMLVSVPVIGSNMWMILKSLKIQSDKMWFGTVSLNCTPELYNPMFFFVIISSLYSCDINPLVWFYVFIVSQYIWFGTYIYDLLIILITPRCATW